MGSSFNNIDWNSLEEVSNNLGSNGAVGTRTPTIHSSNYDYVTATMLELVKRHLEETQVEQIRTVKGALGTEREERTLNDNRLKTCIEKLMTEMVRLNIQFKAMQQRIEGMEKWRDCTSAPEVPPKTIPIHTEGGQSSANEPAAEPPMVKIEGNFENDSHAPATSPTAPVAPEEASPPQPMTAAGSPGRAHQQAESSGQLRPFQLCNVGRIFSSGSLQPQLLRSSDTTMDISSRPGPAVSLVGDRDDKPIAYATASTSDSNFSQAEEEVATSSESGDLIAHGMAGTPGQFLPFLCKCGLEFESDDGLSKHVTGDEQSLQKPMEMPSTSQCSTFTKIDKNLNSPKRPGLRMRIICQKGYTSSILQHVGEQDLVIPVEKLSTSTPPTAQIKISRSRLNPSKRTNSQTGIVHGKDPTLPLFCICGRDFLSIHALDCHICYSRKEKNLPCQICGTKFVFPSDLRGHMKRAHQPGKQNSRSKLVRKPTSLKKLDVAGVGNGNGAHGKSSSRPLHCLCGKQYSNSMALYRHIWYFSKQSVMYPGKPNSNVTLNEVPAPEMGSSSSCPPEGKSGSQQQPDDQEVHIREDPLKKLFGCEFCPRRYHFRSHLWGHMKSQHKMDNYPLDGNGKRVACSACGKSFASFKLLAAHRKAEHN